MRCGDVAVATNRTGLMWVEGVYAPFGPGGLPVVLADPISGQPRRPGGVAGWWCRVAGGDRWGRQDPVLLDAVDPRSHLSRRSDRRRPARRVLGDSARADGVGPRRCLHRRRATAGRRHGWGVSRWGGLAGVVAVVLRRRGFLISDLGFAATVAVGGLTLALTPRASGTLDDATTYAMRSVWSVSSTWPAALTRWSAGPPSPARV